MDSALSEAIPWAEAGELAELVERAGTRGGRRALAAVLIRWADLPAPSQDAVLALPRDLAGALLDAVRWRPRAAPAIADFAERRADWRLAPTLGRLLAARAGEHAFAEALLRTAVASLGPSGRGRPGRLAVLAIDEAVDAALARPTRESERPAESTALAAAVAASRPGPRIAAALDDAAHPVHSALRALAARGDRALLRQLAVRWLDDRRLQGFALRVLGRTRGAAAWSDVLDQGHLLVAATRRRPLRTVTRGLQCVPDRAAVPGLSPRAQISYVRLLERLPFSRPARERLFSVVPELAAPAARLRAADAIAHTDRQRGETLLETLVGDPNHAVARRAAHHLCTGRGLTRVRPGAAEDSPHGSVAHRARQLVARVDAASFFVRWLDLPLPARRAAAAQVDRSDTVRFRRGLAAALAGPVHGIHAALDLVRRLRLADACEDAVIPLLGHAEARVVATAVAALGSARRGSHNHLVGLLDHPDARVRANAIEVVGDRCGTRLVTILRAGRGRERANAVRIVAGVQPDVAGAAVIEMLADPDPSERARGLWSARVVRNDATRAAVAQTAARDAEPAIRSRARAVDRLLGGSA